MSVIQYDNILLPEEFPLNVENMRLPAGYDMGGRMHWHDCFEISAILAGNGAYLVGEERYPMGPGDIVILNNVEPHQLVVNGETLRQTVITFQSGLLYHGMSSVDDLACIAPFLERSADFKNLVPASSRYASRILQLIRDIAREHADREDGWQLMVKAELLALLTLLSRHFGDKVGNSRKRQQLLKLQRVFRHIEENYQRELSLPECAALVSFTPQYFSSFFKQATGTRFIDYLVSVRVHHAAELLRSSSMGVTEIALRCGFNNMGNFNTLFKRHTGMTPSTFRKMSEKTG